MPPEQPDANDLKAAIIFQTERFLTGVESGLPEGMLHDILSEIMNMEFQLIKEHGKMLDPAIWKTLRNRLHRGKVTVPFDPATGNASTGLKPAI